MNRWITLSLTLALGLAACASQAPLTDPVARGKRDFQTKGCMRCHRLGDEGSEYGPGPNLTMVGFRKSSAWIARWLANPHDWNPKTLMPNLHLTTQQISDLADFLSIQKGQAWKVYPWRTKDALGMPSKDRGDLIFNMAGCVGCHGPNGTGGKPDNNVAGGMIPTLTLVSDGYTKAELIQKITNGVTPLPADPSKPKPMIVMPRWGDMLTQDEIGAVADYLISLHPKNKSSDGF